MGLLDVMCVGAVNLDTIAVVPQIPRDDERVLANAFITALGGPAATAAVTLARLGARVGLCAVIGDDEDGARLRDGLEKEGVRTDWMRVAAGATTRSVVLISQASSGRTIVTQRAREPQPEEIPLEAARWIHVDQTGISPTRRALSQSRSAALLSVDGGNPVAEPDLVGVDLYSPSVSALCARYSAAPTLASALAYALADGAAAVVATDGPRGAHVRTADIDEHIPAFDIPVVSTLGAGDVFHGALLAALVEGASLIDATREAGAVAALSCRGIDGQSAIPDRAELELFLRAGSLAAVAGTSS